MARFYLPKRTCALPRAPTCVVVCQCPSAYFLPKELVRRAPTRAAVVSGPMSFQVHHGRRRGSTRAVTAPAFPPDPRPSTAAAQPRETVATAHGGSRDEPLRRPAAFGGSSSVGSLNNQLRAMRATAPSRRSHRDVLLAPLPPLPPRPRLPPRGTLLDQLAQCQANADSLISDMHSTFKSRYDRTGLLLLLPARHLHVGRCAASRARNPIYESAALCVVRRCSRWCQW